MPYFFHLYNHTHANERIIEIPIAKHFLLGSKVVLEVGNVLNHYFRFAHDVVDKFERSPGVINCDVREYESSKRYDLIISISTLEHVGWDEQPKESPEAFYSAVEKLNSLLAPGGKLVATIPLGYNHWLDKQFAAGKLPFDQITAYRRISRMNHWEEVIPNDVIGYRYGTPYHAANALLICVNSAPISNP